MKLLSKSIPNIVRMARREHTDIFDSWIHTTSMFIEETKFLSDICRDEEFNPHTFQKRIRAGSMEKLNKNDHGRGSSELLWHHPPEEHCKRLNLRGGSGCRNNFEYLSTFC
jgi:hypothetical protein